MPSSSSSPSARLDFLHDCTLTRPIVSISSSCSLLIITDWLSWSLLTTFTVVVVTHTLFQLVEGWRMKEGRRRREKEGEEDGIVIYFTNIINQASHLLCSTRGKSLTWWTIQFVWLPLGKRRKKIWSYACIMRAYIFDKTAHALLTTTTTPSLATPFSALE